jgi:hypothetical protein
MSKYFDPIDLSAPTEKPKERAKDPFEGQDFTEILKEIDKEVHLIVLGQHPLVHVALYFPKGPIIYNKGVELVKAKPCRATVIKFLLVCKQEFNEATARHFAHMFKQYDPNLERVLDG